MHRIKQVLTISMLGLVTTLIGCAVNFTSEVGNLMETDYMNYKMSTPTADLSVGGKCPGTKALNVINAETRTAQYCINDTMGCRMYILPRDFNDYVVGYIEDKLEESNLKLSSDSDAKLLVSLKKLKVYEQGFTFGSASKIQIQIPEINYTQTYKGASGSALGHNAAAYAVHLSVVGLIQDPVFQKFVTCNDNLTVKDAAEPDKPGSQTATLPAAIVPTAKAAGTADSKIALKRRYQVAIFPLNIYASGGLSSYISGHEYQGAEAIAAVASEDKNLELKYCYRDFKGVTEGVALIDEFADSQAVDVWKKRSVFSLKEPDWDKIREIGQKINADLIALIGGDISAWSFKYYLFCTKTNKVYSIQADAHYSHFGHITEKTFHELVKDFYRHQ